MAITVFESSAFEEAGLTNITDDTVREDLISVLPTFASGGTDIGAGMELCREVSPNLCDRDIRTKFCLPSRPNCSLRCFFWKI